MKCTNCGMQVPLNAKFCGKCGARILDYQSKINDVAPNVESKRGVKVQCANCGAENEEGSEVCPNCGVGTLDYYLGEIIEEEEKMEESGLIYNLEEALPIYRALAEFAEQTEGVHQKYAKLNGKLSYLKWFVVGYLVLMGLSLLTTPILLLLAFLHRGGGFIAVVVEIILGFVRFVPFIGAIVLTIRIRSKHNKKKEAERAEEIAQIEMRMKKYMEKNNRKELYCVPEKYRYYIAVSYILECLKNERASDLKEAINLYEEQIHRWKMEGYQQQMLALSQEQLRISQLILLTNW